MKVLFEYFGKRKVCKTSEEAIEFISNLYYYGNESLGRIKLNEDIKRSLHYIYESGSVRSKCGRAPRILIGRNGDGFVIYRDYYTEEDEMRTRRGGRTYVSIFTALGDTVEEHDAEVVRRIEEQKLQANKTHEENLTKRYAELSEKREGWYSVELIFQHMEYLSMRMTETTFRGEYVASSGTEAYQKAVAYIETEGKYTIGVTYPDETDKFGYSFSYLGDKGQEMYWFS